MSIHNILIFVNINFSSFKINLRVCRSKKDNLVILKAETEHNHDVSRYLSLSVCLSSLSLSLSVCLSVCLSLSLSLSLSLYNPTSYLYCFAIPKSEGNMVPVATLLSLQPYKASTGFSSPSKYMHNIHVCIHRRTYGSLAVMLNTLSSLNIENIIGKNGQIAGFADTMPRCQVSVYMTIFLWFD